MAGTGRTLAAAQKKPASKIDLSIPAVTFQNGLAKCNDNSIFGSRRAFRRVADGIRYLYRPPGAYSLMGGYNTPAEGAKESLSATMASHWNFSCRK